jgi:hypothetical protein
MAPSEKWRSGEQMEVKLGEYSTEDLIKRHPRLQEIRANLTDSSLKDADRGDGRELINLAALCAGLCEARGCRDDDPLFDLCDRFLHAAVVISVDQERRLGGVGAIAKGVLEYEYEVAKCARSALAVYRDHQRALKYVSHEIFGRTTEEWPAVAEALVAVGLEGLKDWRHRDIIHPVGWVSDKAQHITKDTDAGGRIPVRDALSRGTVSLDVVAKTAGEAVLSPRFTDASIEALVSAANSDEDLRQYLQFRLRPGWKKAAIWDALGWAEDHGRAVDRKFRRLRNTLRRSGAGVESEPESAIRGVSDASCTVAFERFFDGNGTWKFLEKE